MDSSRLKTSVPSGDSWKPPAMSVWVPHCPWCQGWFSPILPPFPTGAPAPATTCPPPSPGRPQDSSENSGHFPSLPLLLSPLLRGALAPSLCPQHREPSPSSPALQLLERPVRVQPIYVCVCVWRGESHFCREKAVGQALVSEEQKPLEWEGNGSSHPFAGLLLSSPSHAKELLGAAGQGGSHITDGETEARRKETSELPQRVSGGDGAGATPGVFWPRVLSLLLPSSQLGSEFASEVRCQDVRSCSRQKGKGEELLPVPPAHEDTWGSGESGSRETRLTSLTQCFQKAFSRGAFLLWSAGQLTSPSAPPLAVVRTPCGG